jgi:hypothetical protein
MKKRRKKAPQFVQRIKGLPEGAVQVHKTDSGVEFWESADASQMFMIRQEWAVYALPPRDSHA